MLRIRRLPGMSLRSAKSEQMSHSECVCAHLAYRSSTLSHHLILPGSATTPEAGYYLASFMKVPKAKQTELAQKIESFCNSPVCTELSVKPIFSIIAPSREDAETLVGLTGYKCEAEARRYLDVRRATKLLASL
jgi:hypothetical protein